jgi:hypothetical protein
MILFFQILATKTQAFHHSVWYTDFISDHRQLQLDLQTLT